MSETAIDELLEKWDEEHVLTKEEALEVLNLPDDKLDKLIETAYALRLKYKGKKVSIQLLTNVRSGNCSQNCAYCAQSCESHAAIEKYKRVSDEKLYGDNDLVDEKHLARHCIGLSGISFTDAEIEDLADRIRKMKKNDTQICCSIGFLTEKQARMLKDAGLNRINHNLNSSRSYYPNICTTHTYDQRINNIRMLKSIGFEMCCGGIIGKHLADFFFRETYHLVKFRCERVVGSDVETACEVVHCHGTYAGNETTFDAGIGSGFNFIEEGTQITFAMRFVRITVQALYI